MAIFSGLTISGGGITIASPPSLSAGWFAGGYYSGGTYYTTVSRIMFASDTVTASSRGPLSISRQLLGGTGTLTYGWMAGGRKPGGNITLSTIDRITYSNDTATAVNRGAIGGNYMGTSQMATSTDRTTYGWWAGGYTGGQGRSFVSRLTFATDTAGTTRIGPLTLTVHSLAGTGNATSGWFGGGYTQLPPGAGVYLSTVQRITYATDTAVAVTKGPLSAGKSSLAGCTDETTYGWYIGGSPAYYSTQRLTFANDTATATVRGSISGPTTLTGSSSEAYGWVAGGGGDAVQRIDFSNDTAASSTRGPLSYSASGVGATSGSA